MIKQSERYMVRRPCVQMMRDYLTFNALKRYPFLYWDCRPDMGKLPVHIASQMRLDGLEKGRFDMMVVAADQVHCRVWLIEFKHGKNDYTPEQAKIAKAAQGMFVECLKIYSPQEFGAFVERELK